MALRDRLRLGWVPRPRRFASGLWARRPSRLSQCPPLHVPTRRDLLSQPIRERIAQSAHEHPPTRALRKSRVFHRAVCTLQCLDIWPHRSEFACYLGGSHGAETTRGWRSRPRFLHHWVEHDCGLANRLGASLRHLAANLFRAAPRYPAGSAAVAPSDLLLIAGCG